MPPTNTILQKVQKATGGSPSSSSLGIIGVDDGCSGGGVTEVDGSGAEFDLGGVDDVLPPPPPPPVLPGVDTAVHIA
jgi:hypothetical protein